MRRFLAALAPLPLLLIATCSADRSGEPAAGETAAPAAAAVPAEAVELHARGLAALENEQPADAEVAYRALAERLPGDPLPWANLAVAQLRQQKTDEATASITKALDVAPAGSEVAGRLQAIRGAILDWTGDPEGALDAYRRAAELAPKDPEVLYSLYRQAVSLGRDEAAAEALGRLAEVRPDNFVVLVERGKQAVQEGDRESATAAFLRIRDLLWQAPPVATTAIEGVLGALEAGAAPADVQAARVPAARLENVLKITPMYRESLRELSSGIQAIPLARFAGAGPPSSFGDPLPVTFRGERLSDAPTLGAALALADLDADGTSDVARLVDRGADGGGPALELRQSGGGEPRLLPAAAGSGLVAADLWNDDAVDLLAYGPDGVALWSGTRGQSGPVLAPADPAATGLAGARAAAATVVDYDLEADLDVVLAGGPAPRIELYRNDLQPRLDPVGSKVLPGIDIPEGVRAVVASDLDRDGDPDLAVAGDFGIRLLDNLRLGAFTDRTAEVGLAAAGPVTALASADLDADGRPELIAAGRGIAVWHNLGGRFEAASSAGLPTSGDLAALAAFDADNDGRLDLAVAGPAGVAIYGQDSSGGFRTLAVEAGPGAATALGAADLDADGDLDLVAAGPEGLHRLLNQGGNRNHWLRVRLRGLVQGNGKNNLAGVGATVEVRSGAAYQFREHDGRVSHFGLGKLDAADVLRVVWNNGVPQNKLDVAGDQTLVEEQVLKGSCPFLYAWDGEQVAFITDLLWGAPVGLPLGGGAWVPADAEELVEVVGARPRSDRAGRYDLRVTEELWEAGYFDYLRLWVVDHPEGVEVASSLRIVPGPDGPPPGPDRVLGSRDVRPVAAAWDGRGRDVTERVRARDDVYADGYVRSLYQGLARAPWTFTFDLGADPGQGPVRLLLDGWIFPTDASINVALAQRADLGLEAPRLEVETAAGWQVLMPSMGHPAGKTKTMVVDTPPLPPGAHRLRIVTNQWISWDRVAWSPRPADGEPRVVAKLAPEAAELRYRGFSALVRRAPNAPHEFDYARTSTTSPWGASPGPYTRHGDVRELLLAADSRPVVLGPGDEIALRFDASALPRPAPGYRRTLFLESHGWDKDYDKHTYAVDRGSLPLPFHGMRVYPWGADERPPDPAVTERFRREWLTRDEPGPDR